MWLVGIDFWIETVKHLSGSEEPWEVWKGWRTRKRGKKETASEQARQTGFTYWWVIFQKNPKFLNLKNYFPVFFYLKLLEGFKAEFKVTMICRWEYVSLNVSTAVKFKNLKKNFMFFNSFHQCFFEVPYVGTSKKLIIKNLSSNIGFFLSLQHLINEFYKLSSRDLINSWSPNHHWVN